MAATLLRDIAKKERYSYMLAHHELGVPLSSMKNAVDMVLGERVGEINANQRRFLSLVDRTIDKLTEMIVKCFQDGVERNPLTQLPGNGAINKEIDLWLHQRRKFALCYVDIDHFKSFNDKYGYVKGDMVIKKTASIIGEALENYGNETDFVGHIGGDDFIIITNPDKVEKVCQYIIDSFDNLVPSFYGSKDRKKGYLECKDRQDNIRRFPLMTISIGVVSNKMRKFNNHLQIAETVSEMKAFAKSFTGSCFKIDNRKK